MVEEFYLIGHIIYTVFGYIFLLALSNAGIGFPYSKSFSEWVSNIIPRERKERANPIGSYSKGNTDNAERTATEISFTPRS